MEYPIHSTESYKGIEIEIYYEQGSENPFENWDGCVPLICDGGHRGLQKDFSNGNILDYLRNFLTYNQVKRNQTKLLNLMDYDVAEFKEDYPLNEYDRTEQIKDDLLYDWLDDGMQNKVDFCESFNIKHYQSTSRGYSQSDWSEVFMCWTPEFGEITGRDYKSIDDSDFKGAFKLFSDWAWGDVYYYFIGETGDSCGGFYGDDFKTNGLLEYAKESIDCHIERRKRVKQSKLKTLIKHNVPFTNRQNILKQI